MANISLRNITKYYDNNLILNKLSLDIKDNEFFCITGPSGCGKTTLLRIIAALDNEEGLYYVAFLEGDSLKRFRKWIKNFLAQKYRVPDDP